MKYVIRKILKSRALSKNNTFHVLLNILFAYLALTAVIMTTLETPPPEEALEPYREILNIFEGG